MLKYLLKTKTFFIGLALIGGGTALSIKQPLNPIGPVLIGQGLVAIGLRDGQRKMEEKIKESKEK